MTSRVTCTLTTIAELEWQGSDTSRPHTRKCSKSLLKTVHTPILEANLQYRIVGTIISNWRDRARCEYASAFVLLYLCKSKRYLGCIVQCAKIRSTSLRLKLKQKCVDSNTLGKGYRIHNKGCGQHRITATRRGTRSALRVPKK